MQESMIHSPQASWSNLPWGDGHNRNQSAQDQIPSMYAWRRNTASESKTAKCGHMGIRAQKKMKWHD